MPEAEFQQDNVQWVRELVALSVKARYQLQQIKRIRRDGSTTGQQEQDAKEEFKHLLDQLWDFYEPKFMYNDDINVDEQVKGELDDAERLEGVFTLDFDHCVTLWYDIRNLQEALGHTRLERIQFEEQHVGGTES